MTPCQEPGAPSMFPDDWGIGRHGRAAQSQALALCRFCPYQRQCAERALSAFDNVDLPPYGVWAGIVFLDVSRVDDKIERLRAIAARELVA